MKAFIITLSSNEYSVKSSEELLLSSSRSLAGTDVHVSRFFATEPKDIHEHTEMVFGRSVPWTWPSHMLEDGMCLRSGLYKKTYPAVDQKRIIACALSHFRLWKECVELDEPIMVLEHDARFRRGTKFNVKKVLDDTSWGAVGLNDPRGNTRKGQKFHGLVAACGEGIHRVPIIDEPSEPPLPMGLAGNSAYMIRPRLAKRLLAECEHLGLWPNDAIMCQQLFPTELKVIYPYVTTVAQGVSTTTGI